MTPIHAETIEILESIPEFVEAWKSGNNDRIFESEGRLYLADAWGTNRREVSRPLFEKLLRSRAVYEDHGMGMELNPAAMRMLDPAL